jgi:hypothetical protein
MKQRAKTKTGNEKNPRELRPSYELKAGFGRREQLGPTSTKEKMLRSSTSQRENEQHKAGRKNKHFFIAIQA